jgi:drug/metabolite transporter (DMT)-like permease
MTDKPAPVLDLTSIFLLLALAMVWGGSFFFAEIALVELEPTAVTLLRVGLSVPVLALILRVKGFRIPRSLHAWTAYLVMGALNNAIPFTLIFWGQTRIDSGLASILNGTTAMFAAVVAGLCLKDEPLTARKIAGALLGILGVAVIMGPEALTGFDPSDLAQLAVLGAALSYAFAGVWGRLRLSQYPPLVNAFGMVTGSTALMLPLVVLRDGLPTPDLSWATWAAVGGLAVLSTALAYALYFAILVRAGAANLLLVTLLIPPFAIGLGVAFLGEALSPSMVAGFAVIAVGFAVTDGRLLDRIRARNPARS